MRAKTMKGELVDIGRYLAQNETTVAIGNGQMNARGDRIGRGGEIIQTRDQTSKEYYEGRGEKTVRKVAVNQLADEVFSTVKQPSLDSIREATTFLSPTEVVAQSDQKNREARKKKIEEVNKEDDTKE